MAIVIENTTKCPLCNDVLNSAKEYILTPALISNMLDEIFLLSDAGVHLECLDKFSIKEKLFKQIDLYDDYINRMKLMMNQYNPQDIISFNLLTSNEQEPLYKYNYNILVKQDLLAWESLIDFRKVANEFLKENKWKGLNQFNYLEYILNVINTTLHSL